MRWLFHLTSPASGPYNMALDEGLMLRAARSRERPAEAVMRVYGWSAPTLSLGRNQRARGCYNLDVARELAVGFVRRPTGGRALLHHREITYSVTMPITDAAHARAAYDLINGVLLRGLGMLGVRASRANGATAIPPGPRPCFDLPSAHEIVLDGRKLVGSAQWRHGGAMLQHGSILVQDDQAMIPRLMRPALAGEHASEPAGAAPVPAPVPATLSQALGREPTAGEVADTLIAALRAETGESVHQFEPDETLRGDVERLCRHYDDASWTWRR